MEVKQYRDSAYIFDHSKTKPLKTSFSSQTFKDKRLSTTIGNYRSKPSYFKNIDH